jgi:RTX calcium-binding nonapeptide repeat (4 copies)
VVRQGHLIAVMRAFLIGCAFLLVVGCAGTSSEAPKEGQGHTEATIEQTRSAKAASEEARCAETQPIDRKVEARYMGLTYEKGLYEKGWFTNDVPGCPNGGLLLGTDKPDVLDGLEGDDEIRGLGAKDHLIGGLGSDVLYGGPGDDSLMSIYHVRGSPMSKDVFYGGPGNDFLVDDGGPGDNVYYGGDGDDVMWAGRGEEVIYGGDGNDAIETYDSQRDKIYCGKGKDHYTAGKNDYVDSSCEGKQRGPQA